MRKLLLLLLLLVSVASAQKTVKARQYTRKDGAVASAHVAEVKNGCHSESTDCPSARSCGACRQKAGDDHNSRCSHAAQWPSGA